MQQLKAKLLAQLAEAIDQLFLQTVELVAARRQLAGVELIFQPDPLEEGRFIQRGRGVGIVLQQLRFADAIPRPGRDVSRATAGWFSTTDVQNPVCLGMRNLVISSSLAITFSTTWRHI